MGKESYFIKKIFSLNVLGNHKWTDTNNALQLLIIIFIFNEMVFNINLSLNVMVERSNLRVFLLSPSLMRESNYFS